MSKLAAIYSALDSGNPKSALRLCQQALTKSNSQIVRALMALAHSRLDQSDETIVICESIEKENPSDSTVIETLGFIYRREHLYDRLALLYSKSESDVELLRGAFIAAVQSKSVDLLSPLALKLSRLTGDKIYFAWAAFGLSMSGGDKNLSLAIVMLDKSLSGYDSEPHSQGENRSSTSARLHAYLSLFKLQLLARMENWTEAKQVIENLKSGLISDFEKNQLIEDIHLFSGETIDRLSSLQPSAVTQLEDIIRTDCGKSDCEINWNDLAKYQSFLDRLKDHITVSMARSDCVITTAPFLALVQPDDVSGLVEYVRPLGQSSDLEFLNGQKLIYGLDKTEVSFSEILDRSVACIERGESATGEQLLLFSAIVLMEKLDSDFSFFGDVVTILEYGARRFQHCSHFRLIQCILYTRWGLMARGVERFESLGIKNAQWRNLFWIISSGVDRFFCVEKPQLLSEVESFFDRNRADLMYALSSIVEESLFFKYSDFVEEIENSDLSKKSLNDDDYSPLLFISMPKVGSQSTAAFTENLDQKRRFKSRACGFRWPKEVVGKYVPYQKRDIPLSEDRVIGRYIRPCSADDTSRHRLRELITNMSTIESEKTISEIRKIFAIVESGSWFETLEWAGRVLNGDLQLAITLIEEKGSSVSKKNPERKQYKQLLSCIRSEIDTVVSGLKNLKFDFVTEPSCLRSPLLEHRPEALERLKNDLNLDIAGIESALLSLVDRIKQSKL